MESARGPTPWPEKAAPAAPRGLLGMSLEEARATHFFTWFHLEPAAHPDAYSVVFRPSGAKFHELAAVGTHSDGAKRINAVDLALLRSFIADPREGMFAADIAKSFLEAALAGSDRDHMQHLIDTLAYAGRYERPVIIAADATRRQPEILTSSAPYLVWRRENDYWQRPFEGVLLVLESLGRGEGEFVRLFVGVS